jgi:predicted nucleic acid-binding protein
MKKATIYIETSIISYLAARPSSNLATAACQQVTAEWWESHRDSYHIVTSSLVVAECGEGDLLMAQKRLDLLRDIPVLTITDQAADLAKILTSHGKIMPRKAQADALHIAIAAVHNSEYLLTWNCRHIDNPAIKPIVRKVCTVHGYTCPEICTPFEIMEIG